jgi:formate hydrogenlyase subunit 4
MTAARVAHFLALLVLPLLFVGLINRTKALWSGRRGPPLLQSFFDLWRLLKKRPIYSTTTTALFRAGPLVLLATTGVSALFIPLFGGPALFSFPFDFVAVAYLWGLGRLFLALAALDTGSSFEGMGASRETTFSALVEPALFLTLGALGLANGHSSLGDLLHVDLTSLKGITVTLPCALALLLVLQVEAGRVPVDDPATHLELTMVHEVMVLDHSGPELACVQYAAALKMTLLAVLLASLLNPMRGAGSLTSLVVLALTLGLAVVIGCVESLMARLKLRAVPGWIFTGAWAAAVALLAAAWGRGTP